MKAGVSTFITDAGMLGAPAFPDAPAIDCEEEEFTANLNSPCQCPGPPCFRKSHAAGRPCIGTVTITSTCRHRVCSSCRKQKSSKKSKKNSASSSSTSLSSLTSSSSGILSLAALASTSYSSWLGSAERTSLGSRGEDGPSSSRSTAPTDAGAEEIPAEWHDARLRISQQIYQELRSVPFNKPSLPRMFSNWKFNRYFPTESLFPN
jgi:hypothetical protein